MGNDESLRSEVLSGAGEAGEQMWPMPLPAHLRRGLDATGALPDDGYGRMGRAGLDRLAERLADG